MIRQGYRDSRFPNEDVPLLHHTEQALDYIEADGDTPCLEVLSGANYRRKVIDRAAVGRDSRLGEVAYLLQVIVAPTTVGSSQWLVRANQITDQLAEAMEASGEEVEVFREDAFIKPPKDTGPFGHADTWDSIWEVHQPLVAATHTQGDGRVVEVRAAVASPKDGPLIDTFPQSWGAWDVAHAKKGGVVIPFPEEQVK